MPDTVLRIVSGRLSEAQIASVAHMHAEEVPQGFLSSLGEPVLRMLYRHLSASRHSVVFLAERVDDGAPMGYICGTRDTSALYREFLRSSWRVAARVVARKLLSVRRLLRALETLRYPSHAPAGLPRAEIINFVVRPDKRGTKVATVLFGDLMQWFGDQGDRSVKIVTGERQERAHGFYAKSGAVLCGRTSVHHGTTSRIYVYHIAEALPVTRHPHPRATFPRAVRHRGGAP